MHLAAAYLNKKGKRSENFGQRKKKWEKFKVKNDLPQGVKERENYSELLQVKQELEGFSDANIELCNAISSFTGLSLSGENSCLCVDEIAADTRSTVFANMPEEDDSNALDPQQLIKKMYDNLEHRKLLLEKILELESPLPSDLEFTSDDESLDLTDSSDDECIIVSDNSDNSDKNDDEDWVDEEEFDGKSGKSRSSTRIKKAKCRAGKKKYPKRNMAIKNYKEDPVSDEDEYIYCDHCQFTKKGRCEEHHPLYLIKDTKVPSNCAEEFRAFATIPRFLSFGISGIAGAGMGVWAKSTLPEHCVFGPYKGLIEYDGKKAKTCGFAWQIQKNGKFHHYVDGQDLKHSNWMRFVNCANFEQQQNLIAFQYKGKIYYRTYKKVLPAHELLVWYGDSYAKDLGINVSQPPVEESFKRLDPVYPCSFCDRLFTSLKILEGHVKNSHTQEIRIGRYKCTCCSYSTEIAAHLKSHLLIHTGEKPFVCDLCGKGFNRKTNFNVHFRIHTKEKPFKCDFCGKGFNQNGDLERHIRTHTKEKPYVCDQCNKGFTISSDLNKHKRIHTGDKPYKCPYCLIRFAHISYLKSHLKHKHN